MVALTYRSLPAKLFLSLLIVMNASVFAFSESQSDSNAPSVSAETLDDADRTTLLDNRHPLSMGMADKGPIADDTSLSKMILILKRSPDQVQSIR